MPHRLCNPQAEMANTTSRRHSLQNPLCDVFLGHGPQMVFGGGAHGKGLTGVVYTSLQVVSLP